MTLPLHVERRASSRPDPLPVVMLHGWGMNLRVFDLLRAELGDERETWAVDLPGHGRSPWSNDAMEFAAQRDAVIAVLPPRCVLLGWSFGAKLALDIAVREPARVAALALLCASPKFARSADWPQGMDNEALRAFRTILEQDWQRTLSDFVWLQLRGSRNAEDAQQVLQSALAAQGAPRLEALRNGLALLGDTDLRALVPRVSQPALVVCGQNDRVTSPAAAGWLAQHLPDARLVEIARAGHAPFVSHPQEVGAALREFLATLPQPVTA